jgi:plastocyanin
MANRTFGRVGAGFAAVAMSLALLFGVVGATTASAARPAAKKPPHTVSISNFQFVPKTLTVAKGTKVTWTNNDTTGHNVTFTAFKSKTLAHGKKFSHVFATAGTFSYKCTIHPGMSGKIVVTG